MFISSVRLVSDCTRGEWGSGDGLSFLWHSLQIAIVESPRTETTPGAGCDVEHSEQVGVKWLVSIPVSAVMQSYKHPGCSISQAINCRAFTSTASCVNHQDRHIPRQHIDDRTSLDIQIPSAHRVRMYQICSEADGYVVGALLAAVVAHTGGVAGDVVADTLNVRGVFAALAFDGQVEGCEFHQLVRGSC